MWKNFYVFILGTTVLSYSGTENENQITDSVYVDELTSNYLSVEKDIWNDILTNTNLENVIPKIHRQHLRLFSNEFLNNENELNRFSTLGKPFIDIGNEMMEVNLKVRIVKNNYLHDSTDPDSLKKEILNMAKNNSKTTLMDTLYDAITGEDFFGIIKKIGDNQECTKYGQTIESTNYQLFQYYNTIAKSSMLAYAIVQLSYMFLAVYGEKSYIEKAKILHKSFEERTRKTQERVRELMIHANRDVWKCDLSPLTYDESIYQITHLVEGYVENEVNLNSENVCTKSCSDYSNTKTYGCLEDTLCDKAYQNPKARCNGTVLNCDFIEADMKICITENYSSRRYTNIVLNSGRKLGTDNCHRATTSISSWTRWFVQCSNCFCYCDEPNEHSERYFSLKDVVSDASLNKIITGIGLYKRKGIFTWDIVQSDFLSNGQVNVSQTWDAFVAIEKFQPENEGVDGVDYHRLSWQNRSINLDTIIAPAGSVVTGVRFKLIDGVLNLQIRATKFEFSTGILHNDHEWISNSNENLHRLPINLLNSDIPSRASVFSTQIKDVNKFVQFQPTGIEQDVAQTTIPFIDSQLIEAFDRQSPLSGIGIFFKGVPGFGGFIAPKVITYDMSSHIGKAFL